MVTLTERVRFYETDLMGVVYHANYFHWFEMGRIAYLRHGGIDLNKMMEDGFVFPVVDVSCHYRQSARFDDEIIIETTLLSCSKVKVVFSYVLRRKADNAVLAEGRSTNAFTTPEGKVERLSEKYYQKLQNLMEEERNKEAC
ncbi:MAG: acyl-CoA thioesterase [Acidaminococcus sp.]|jgi:acyl-CoA thioester hydrolase|nr:acyl-CoA thioesterase [Acidaminococcus sp.]MCI2099792.1 acyl-CoA thioesterase [Acidaminococcus sp.]MCI2114020.1 acyl-CoA thioesterase [Acidaminococcus sp.]MCI2115890.1 acyl-CoA thioesterase [Acidaminococcus sp.]